MRTLLLILSLCLVPIAQAENKIWVALLRADNTESPHDPRIATLVPRLKTVFGFDHYQLIGEATVPTGQKYAEWILPRKDFYIKIEPLPSKQPDTAPVNFELYHDKQLLGKALWTDLSTPTFIKGPDCSKGQLIFVLEFVPDKI